MIIIEPSILSADLTQLGAQVGEAEAAGAEAIQVDKIRRLRNLLDARSLRIPIAVDGGIDQATTPLVVAAGATVLVAGSSVFNQRAPVAHNIAFLRASAETAFSVAQAGS